MKLRLGFFRGLRAFLPAALLLAAGGCGRQEARPAGGPSRIIAVTPSVTETLFALGLGSRVIGVGDYSVWPPEEVARKPRVGGLFNPNLEGIVALHPDLAVLIPSERELGGKLSNLGIEVLAVENETLADIERSFATIAERCGVPEAGERLAAEWHAGVAPRPLPGGAHPRVLISVGRPPGRLSEAVIAGPGTFYDELLGRLGAVNAFADSPTLYLQLPLEQVVAHPPDVIIELRSEPVSASVAEALRRDWEQLPGLPPVPGGRAEVIAASYSVTPGPRLPLFYRDLRAAIVKHLSVTDTAKATETEKGSG